MERLLPQAAFDRLFPFSCVVESGGRIVQVGRSLRKFSPSALEGAELRQAFRLEQPSFGISSFEPAKLVDEFVRLLLAESPKFVLRGQVVPVGSNGELYILSLAPDIARMKNLEEFGLDFSDFAIAEPVVDHMILSSLFRQTRESIEVLYARLAWRESGTNLLHTLAADIFRATEEREVCRITMERVCEMLKWDVGLVFMAPEGEAHVVPAAFSRVLGGGKFEDLLMHSKETLFSFSEGMPGYAAKVRDIFWTQDVMRDARFPRAAVLHFPQRLTGVALPIVCGKKVLAVLEFFTERVFSNPKSAIQLFDLIRRQVEHQVARLQAARLEREREAMLVSAAKMATLGELAAGVAHEINNPVSAISMTTEVLRRLGASGAISSEVLATQVSRIQKCLSHITTIVSDMQSFSRDASRDPIKEHRVGDLVSGALNLCGAKFMSQKVELKLSEISPEWTSSCRAAQVSQVILNLLSNSFDAVVESPRPWVRVEVTDEGESFALSVVDSGLGIPEEIRDKMMTPFFTTKLPGKGTGLGLGICRNIMHAMGGDLLYRADAANTTFVARLPKICRQQ